MPPLQPSLRGSLLTGASALVLSVSASGAHGQGAPRSMPQSPLPTWTVWVEGALFWTGGGSFNIPSIPGLGAPYTSFNPRNGLEGAFGFNYQWPSQPWHFIFDFRYGKTNTATSNSAGSSSSSSTSFMTNGRAGFNGSVLLTTTISRSTANATATQGKEWESHLVADFMIGRDVGLGSSTPEFQFGFRVADLHAAVQALQSAQSTTITNTTRTFYSGFPIFGPVTTQSSSSSSSAFSAFAAWNSGFFGTGPRLAIAGGVPIMGSWSFDYSGGIAGLIGDRSFDVAMGSSAGPGFAATFRNIFFVFNADGWAALSYVFTPHFKASAGIRGDFYSSALMTYNINTGGLASIDRFYWGPLVRLTGSF